MISLEVLLHVSSCTHFPGNEAYVKVFDDTGNTKRPMMMHLQEIILAEGGSASSQTGSVTASQDRMQGASLGSHPATNTTTHSGGTHSTAAAARVAALGPDSGSLATTLHRIAHPSVGGGSISAVTPRSAAFYRRSKEGALYDELDNHRRQESGDADDFDGRPGPSALVAETSKCRNESSPKWNESFPLDLKVPVEALVAGCALKVAYDMRYAKQLPNHAPVGQRSSIADAATDQVIARLVYLVVMKRVREKSLLKALERMEGDANTKVESPTLSETSTGSRLRNLAQSLPTVLRMTCFDYRKGLDVFSGETMMTSMDVFETPPLRPLHSTSHSRQISTTPLHPDTPQRAGLSSWGNTRRSRRLQLASDVLVDEMTADVQTAGDVTREGFSEDLADQLEGHFRERLHRLYLLRPINAPKNTTVVQTAHDDDELCDSQTGSDSTTTSSSSLNSGTVTSATMGGAEDSVRGVPFYDECGGLRKFNAHPSHDSSSFELNLTDSARQHIGNHITSLVKFILGCLNSEESGKDTNNNSNNTTPIRRGSETMQHQHHTPAGRVMSGESTYSADAAGSGSQPTATSTSRRSTRKSLLLWKFLFLEDFLSSLELQKAMRPTTTTVSSFHHHGSGATPLQTTTDVNPFMSSVTSALSTTSSNATISTSDLFKNIEHILRIKKSLPIVSGIVGSKLIVSITPNTAAYAAQRRIHKSIRSENYSPTQLQGPSSLLNPHLMRSSPGSLASPNNDLGGAWPVSSPSQPTRHRSEEDGDDDDKDNDDQSTAAVAAAMAAVLEDKNEDNNSNSGTFVQHSISSMSPSDMKQEQQVSRSLGKATRPFALPIKDLLTAHFTDEESSSFNNTRNSAFGGGLAEEQLRRELENIELANDAASQKLMENSFAGATPLLDHFHKYGSFEDANIAREEAISKNKGDGEYGANMPNNTLLELVVPPPLPPLPVIATPTSYVGPTFGESMDRTKASTALTYTSSMRPRPLGPNPISMQQQSSAVMERVVPPQTLLDMSDVVCSSIRTYLHLWGVASSSHRSSSHTSNKQVPPPLLPVVCEWLAKYASTFNSIHDSVWNTVVAALLGQSLAESLLVAGSVPIANNTLLPDEGFLGHLLAVQSLLSPIAPVDFSTEAVLKFTQSTKGHDVLHVFFSSWVTSAIRQRYEVLGEEEWVASRATILGGCTLPTYIRMWLVPAYVRKNLHFRVGSILESPRSFFLLHIGDLTINFKAPTPEELASYQRLNNQQEQQQHLKSVGGGGNNNHTHSATNKQPANLLALDDAEEELTMSSQGYRLVRRTRLWKMVLSRITLQDEEGNSVDAVLKNNTKNTNYQNNNSFLSTTTTFIPKAIQVGAVVDAFAQNDDFHQEVLRFNDAIPIPASEVFSAALAASAHHSRRTSSTSQQVSSLTDSIRAAFMEAGGMDTHATSTARQRIESMCFEQERSEYQDHDLLNQCCDVTSLELLLFCETQSTYSLVRGRRGQIHNMPPTPGAALGNKPSITQTRATLAGCGFTYLTQKSLLEMALCPTCPEFLGYGSSLSPLFRQASKEAGVPLPRSLSQTELNSSPGLSGRQEASITLYSPEVFHKTDNKSPTPTSTDTNTLAGIIAVRQATAGVSKQEAKARRRDLLASAPSFVNPRIPLTEVPVTAYHSNYVPAADFRIQQNKLFVSSPAFDDGANIPVEQGTSASRPLPGLSTSRSSVLASPALRRQRVVGSTSGDVHCSLSLRISKIILYRSASTVITDSTQESSIFPTPSVNFQDVTVTVSSTNSALRSCRSLYALDSHQPEKQLTELRQGMPSTTTPSSSSSPNISVKLPTSASYGQSIVKELDMTTSLSLTPVSRVVVIAVSALDLSVKQSDMIMSSTGSPVGTDGVPSSSSINGIMAGAQAMFAAPRGSSATQFRPYLVPTDGKNNHIPPVSAGTVGLAEFNPYDHIHEGSLWVTLRDGAQEIGLVQLNWSSVFHFIVSPLGHLYPATPARRWSSLELNIIEAKGLAAASLGGSANPFCAVQLLPLHLNMTQTTTATIRQTQCPTWNAILNLELPPNETSGFVISVLDHDMDVSSDNGSDKLTSSRFIGACTIHCDAPLWQVEEGTMWLPLIPSILGSGHLGDPVKIISTSDRKSPQRHNRRGSGSGLTTMSSRLLSDVSSNYNGALQQDEMSSDHYGSPLDPLAFPSSSDTTSDEDAHNGNHDQIESSIAFKNNNDFSNLPAGNTTSSSAYGHSKKKRVSFGGSDAVTVTKSERSNTYNAAQKSTPALRNTTALSTTGRSLKRKSSNNVKVSSANLHDTTTTSSHSQAPMSVQGMVRIQWRFSTHDELEPNKPSIGDQCGVTDGSVGLTQQGQMSGGGGTNTSVAITPGLPHPLAKGNTGAAQATTRDGRSVGCLTIKELRDMGTKMVCRGMQVRNLPVLLASSSSSSGGALGSSGSTDSASFNNNGGATLEDLLVREVSAGGFGSGVFASEGSGRFGDLQSEIIDPSLLQATSPKKQLQRLLFLSSSINEVFRIRVFAVAGDLNAVQPPQQLPGISSTQSSQDADTTHQQQQVGGIFEQVVSKGNNNNDEEEDDSTASAAFGNALRGVSNTHITSAFEGFFDAYPGVNADYLIIEIYSCAAHSNANNALGTSQDGGVGGGASTIHTTLVGVGGIDLHDARFTHGEAFVTCIINDTHHPTNTTTSPKTRTSMLRHFLMKFYSSVLIKHTTAASHHSQHRSSIGDVNTASELALLRSSTESVQHVANLDDLLKAVTSPQLLSTVSILSPPVDGSGGMGGGSRRRLGGVSPSTHAMVTLKLEAYIDGSEKDIDSRNITDMLSLTRTERHRRNAQKGGSTLHQQSLKSIHFQAPNHPLAATEFDSLWKSILSEQDARHVSRNNNKRGKKEPAWLKWSSPLLSGSEKGYLNISPILVRGLDFSGLVIVEGDGVLCEGGDGGSGVASKYATTIASVQHCDILLPQTQVSISPPPSSTIDNVDMYPRFLIKVYRAATNTKVVPVGQQARLEAVTEAQTVSSLRKSLALVAKSTTTSASPFSSVHIGAVGPGLAAKRRALRHRYLSRVDGVEQVPSQPPPAEATPTPSTAMTIAQPAAPAPSAPTVDNRRELICSGLFHLCDVDENRGTAWVRLCDGVRIVAGMEVRFEHNYLPNAAIVGHASESTSERQSHDDSGKSIVTPEEAAKRYVGDIAVTIKQCRGLPRNPSSGLPPRAVCVVGLRQNYQSTQMASTTGAPDMSDVEVTDNSFTTTPCEPSCNPCVESGGVFPLTALGVAGSGILRLQVLDANTSSVVGCATGCDMMSVASLWQSGGGRVEQHVDEDGMPSKSITRTLWVPLHPPSNTTNTPSSHRTPSEAQITVRIVLRNNNISDNINDVSGPFQTLLSDMSVWDTLFPSSGSSDEHRPTTTNTTATGGAVVTAPSSSNRGQVVHVGGVFGTVPPSGWGMDDACVNINILSGNFQRPLGDRLFVALQTTMKTCSSEAVDVLRNGGLVDSAGVSENPFTIPRVLATTTQLRATSTPHWSDIFCINVSALAKLSRLQQVYNRHNSRSDDDTAVFNGELYMVVYALSGTSTERIESTNKVVIHADGDVGEGTGGAAIVEPVGMTCINVLPQTSDTKNVIGVGTAPPLPLFTSSLLLERVPQSQHSLSLHVITYGDIEKLQGGDPTPTTTTLSPDQRLHSRNSLLVAASMVQYTPTWVPMHFYVRPSSLLPISTFASHLLSSTSSGTRPSLRFLLGASPAPTTAGSSMEEDRLDVSRGGTCFNPPSFSTLSSPGSVVTVELCDDHKAGASVGEVDVVARGTFIVPSYKESQHHVDSVVTLYDVLSQGVQDTSYLHGGVVDDTTLPSVPMARLVMLTECKPFVGDNASFEVVCLSGLSIKPSTDASITTNTTSASSSMAVQAIASGSLRLILRLMDGDGRVVSQRVLAHQPDDDDIAENDLWTPSYDPDDADFITTSTNNTTYTTPMKLYADDCRTSRLSAQVIAITAAGGGSEGETIILAEADRALDMMAPHDHSTTNKSSIMKIKIPLINGGENGNENTSASFLTMSVRRVSSKSRSTSTHTREFWTPITIVSLQRSSLDYTTTSSIPSTVVVPSSVVTFQSDRTSAHHTTRSNSIVARPLIVASTCLFNNEAATTEMEFPSCISADGGFTDMVLRTVIFPQEDHTTTTTTTNTSSTLSLYSRLSGQSKTSNNNSGITTTCDRGVFVGSVRIDALRNAINGEANCHYNLPLWNGTVRTPYCMSVFRHPRVSSESLQQQDNLVKEGHNNINTTTDTTTMGGTGDSGINRVVDPTLIPYTSPQYFPFRNASVSALDGRLRCNLHVLDAMHLLNDQPAHPSTSSTEASTAKIHSIGVSFAGAEEVVVRASSGGNSVVPTTRFSPSSSSSARILGGTISRSSLLGAFIVIQVEQHVDGIKVACTIPLTRLIEVGLRGSCWFPCTTTTPSQQVLWIKVAHSFSSDTSTVNRRQLTARPLSSSSGSLVPFTPTASNASLITTTAATSGRLPSHGFYTPHTPKWGQRRIEYTLLEFRSGNALPLRQLLQQQQPHHTQPPSSRDAAVEEGAGLAKLVITSIEGLMFDPLPSIAGKAVFDTPNNNNTEKSRKRSSATSPLTEFVVSVHLSGAPSSTSNSSASMISDATSRLALLLQQQSQSSELTTESVLSRLEKEEGQYSKQVEKALQSRVTSKRRSAGASSSSHVGSSTSIEEELGRSNLVTTSISGYALTQDGDLQTDMEYLEHPRKCTVVFPTPLTLPMSDILSSVLTTSSSPSGRSVLVVSVWRKQQTTHHNDNNTTSTSPSLSNDGGFVFMGQGEIHATGSIAAASLASLKHHKPPTAIYRESKPLYESLLAETLSGQIHDNSGALLRVIAALAPREDPVHLAADKRRIEARLDISKKLAALCVTPAEVTDGSLVTDTTSNNEIHNSQNSTSHMFGVLQGFIVSGGQSSTILCGTVTPRPVAPLPYTITSLLLSNFEGSNNRGDASAGYDGIRKAATLAKRIATTSSSSSSTTPAWAPSAAAITSAAWSLESLHKRVAPAPQQPHQAHGSDTRLLMTVPLSPPLPPCLFMVVIPTSITITSGGGAFRRSLELVALCSAGASKAALRRSEKKKDENEEDTAVAQPSPSDSCTLELVHPLVLGPVSLLPTPHHRGTHHRRKHHRADADASRSSQLLLTSGATVDVGGDVTGSSSSMDDSDSSDMLDDDDSPMGADSDSRERRNFESKLLKEQYARSQSIASALTLETSNKSECIPLFISLTDATNQLVVASATTMVPTTPSSTSSRKKAGSKRHGSQSSVEGCFAHTDCKLVLVGDLVGEGKGKGDEVEEEGVVIRITLDVLITRNHQELSYATDYANYLQQRNYGTSLSDMTSSSPQAHHRPPHSLLSSHHRQHVGSSDGSKKRTSFSEKFGRNVAAMSTTPSRQVATMMGDDHTVDASPASDTSSSKWGPLSTVGGTSNRGGGGSSVAISWGGAHPVTTPTPHHSHQSRSRRYGGVDAVEGGSLLSTPQPTHTHQSLVHFGEGTASSNNVAIYQPSPPKDDPRSIPSKFIMNRNEDAPIPTTPTSDTPPTATHPPLPVAHFGGGCAYNGKLYMFGGCVPSTPDTSTLTLRDPHSPVRGQQASTNHHAALHRRLRLFTPQTDFSELSDHHQRHGRSTATSATMLALSPNDRHPSALCGITNQLKSFDPSTNEWRDVLLSDEQEHWRMASAADRQHHMRTRAEQPYAAPGDAYTLRRPPPRFRHSCVAYNDSLYVFGGWGIDPENAFNPTLDGVTGRYETLSGVFVVQNDDDSRLNNGGGEMLPLHPHAGLLDTTWRYDFIRREWSELRTSALPSPTTHISSPSQVTTPRGATDPDLDIAMTSSLANNNTSGGGGLNSNYGTHSSNIMGPLSQIVANCREHRNRDGISTGGGGDAQDFRTDHVAFVLGSLMIVHGGWKVDIVETVAKSETNGLVPKDTHNLSAKFSRRSDMAALDLLTGLWSTVPQSPDCVHLPIVNHAACLVQNRAYIYGGLLHHHTSSNNGTPPICSTTIYALTVDDPIGVRWEPVVPMSSGKQLASFAPAGRFGHSMASSSGTSSSPSTYSAESATISKATSFFIFGGVLVANTNSTADDHSRFVWQFDTVVKMWSRFDTTPSPRGPLRHPRQQTTTFHGEASVGGCAVVVPIGITSCALVVAGGADVDGSGVLPSLSKVASELVEPPPSISVSCAPATSLTLVSVPSTASRRFLQRNTSVVMPSYGSGGLSDATSSHGLTSSSSSASGPQITSRPDMCCAVGVSILY